MSRIADEMLTDIEKEVVDFQPNFDNKLREPVVLPSKFPNLLVNGSVGIAVGMATNVPPHNLGEVIDGTVYFLDHPEASLSELMNFIKGPDFPTAAIICGINGIREAYATGKGRIIVRGRAEIEEEKHRIVVTEIPYAVNKVMMVEAMAACVKDKRIEGITAIRDESGRDGLRVVIEFRHDANGTLILNQLYKYTPLQDTFAVNMLAIVDGVPKVLPLIDYLKIYIGHQEEVVTRRIRFDLEKALKEMHIYEGYRFAIDNIDRVISVIRSSPNVEQAKINLMNEFKTAELSDQLTELSEMDSTANGGLSEAQASAIVAMTLGRLSGLERDKILSHLAELQGLVKGYREDLASEGRIREIIKEDLLAIKNRFADPRRTEIVQAENELVYEDLIDRHTCVVTLTHAGYIKRLNSDTYQSQKRGGKGIIGMTTKEEDFVEQVIAVDTHSYLMLFTNKGKVYTIKAYRVPESGRLAKGSNIVNLIEVEPGEKITSMISVPEFNPEEKLLFVTMHGIVKRTALSEFEIQRKGGKIALDLEEGDELLFVRRTSGQEEILLATRQGNATRFAEDDVRVMGRTARGVRGMKLGEGDFVVGCVVVDNEKKLLTITDNGLGKRTSFEEYSLHSRGGKGMCCHNLTDRSGLLTAIAAVGEEDDVMLITSTGTVIRMPVSDIPVYGRNASGVIAMRLEEGAKLVNMAVLTPDQEKMMEADGEDGESADGSQETEE
jgi:DNA gyrase subunit A